MLGEFVLSPERFEFIFRHGQVVLVDAATTTAVEDVHRWFHGYRRAHFERKGSPLLLVLK